MKYLVIDLETEGTNPFVHRLHGVAAAADGQKPAYFPASSVPSWVVDAVASKDIIKIGSNIRQFDLNFLGRLNWRLGGLSYDTSLMSLLLESEENRHGLKQVTERRFGKEKLAQKNELDAVLAALKLRHVGELCSLDLNDPTHPYFDLIGKYACEDAINTWNVFVALKEDFEKIHLKFKALLGKTPLQYFKNEVVPTEAILLKMEMTGVRVNKQLLDDIRQAAVEDRVRDIIRFKELCATEIADIEKSLLQKELAKKGPKGQANILKNPQKYGVEFNIDSSAHMGELIYNKLECPTEVIKRTKTKALSTKEEHLKLVASSVDSGSKLAGALDLYWDIKKSAKLISTYTGNEAKGVASLLQERDGQTWLYPTYKQRTATGRLSCYPIQQLPGKYRNPKAAVVKKFFIPSTPDHCFVYSDLPAIEFRNAAYLSQDTVMLKMLRENIDPHITLAARVFNKPEQSIKKGDKERDVAKTINYLQLYGGEEGRLAQELNLKQRLSYSKDQCKQFLLKTRELYAGYWAYLQSLKGFVETHGYVTAVNGRIRHLPDIFYGKYLDHDSKVFFGPRELYFKLLEHGGERPSQTDLYYRARGRYKHALNQAYNFPNQSLGGTEMKNVLKKLDSAGLVIRASIHDAIYVECLKTDAVAVAKFVKECMDNCYPLGVPIDADTKILTSFSEDDIFLQT